MLFAITVWISLQKGVLLKSDHTINTLIMVDLILCLKKKIPGGNFLGFYCQSEYW